ncbi:MAG: aminotransferase class IV [Algoriphagus sp.]|nr:aminotransferase class IV [Algoriphagus sp.]
MSEIETVFSKSGNKAGWIEIDNFPVPNRAMNFGDGLFETMVFDQDHIRFSNHHIARLHHGLDVLNLDGNNVDFEGLESFLNRNFFGQKLRIRWNVFRSGSGKYTPQSSSTDQTIQVSKFISAPKTKLTAFISDRIRLFPTAWSACKTLNSLPYILANQERVKAKMDEVILLDYRGFLSEAGSSNLFWRKGGEFFTPSLDCSCLNGIARKVILEELIKLELPIQVGDLLPQELLSAEQVWVCNVTGISYLAQIEQKEYSTERLSIFQNLFE